MRSAPRAAAAETVKVHEPMMIDGTETLVDRKMTITATAAPDIARARAILQAAKRKTFGTSPR